MNKLVFLLIHLGCFLAIWCGVSAVAVFFCLAFYLIRMFAITAGYHRLFSHRSYQTSRFFQFVLAFLGAASAQRGPLWWAANHRHHHRHSDTEEDIHSPGIRGIWWAHAGWVLSDEDRVELSLVKDLSAFPELRLLDRFHYVPALMFLGGTFLLGFILDLRFPEWHTSGLQLMVWGALVSTVILYHCTFAINSLAHILGSKRFRTDDESRNSLFLALITLGEGWHNNHHRYPGSERQGFYWWEIDITHYVLKCLAVCGIVWDLREPPARIYEEAKNLR